MSMIISQKPIKATTIHNVLKQAWAKYGSVTISDVSYKVVMFEFENDDDQKQIFDMSPWSVQGQCLSMKKWMSNFGLAHVDFNKVQFWVQVHDFGLEKFSVENTQVIGNKIGSFIETGEEVESTQKSYMRMNVDVNVEDPLMVGFSWTNSRGVEQ